MIVYFSGAIQLSMGRKSSKKKQARAKKNAEPVKAKPKLKPNPIIEKPTTDISSGQAWVLSALFFVIAILLYSNTFQHGFVLDDHGIIDNNKMTKATVSMENTKLMFNTPMRRGDVSDKENSLYRPFTKLIFNMQWNAFAGNPHHFHKINVLFYGLLCMIIFWVLYDLFNKKWVLPFLITLLFTVHPIHTEVVANIKSLDEILAMLGMVVAMRGIQLYLTSNNFIHLFWSVLAFALGLFSKESAVVAMAIFPLLVYFQQTKIDYKKMAMVCAPLLVVAIFFVLTRSSVLGQFPQNAETSIMDNLIVMVKDDIPARFATAVMIVGFYIYTFFVPHPLACDYSYATLEPVGLGHWGFLLSFVLCLGGFVYAVYTLTKRKKISFGILWFFITFSLASNVFFLIGTSFGERLFFTPSLGLSIVTVCLLARFFQKGEGKNLLATVKSSPVLWGVVLLISSLYSIKTVARNVDWKNDYNLFSRDIEYNPNSTHLLFYMGNHLPSNDRKEVLTYQLSELGFSPQQINDSSNREVALSIQYFRRSLSIYPYLPADGYNQLGKAYFLQGQLDSALKYYTKAFSEDSTSGIYTNNMGTVYFNSRQFDKAMPYFKKAHSLDDTKADYMNNIGCIYGESNVADSAIYWFKKANAADSLDMKSLQFLDITYRALGDVATADFYKSRLIYVQQLRQQMIQ
jgi:hypothetical protein